MKKSIETKGSLEESQLRESEKAKIEYAIVTSPPSLTVASVTA